MAISLCNTTTDGTHRELAEHGSLAFPIACYRDDLSSEGVMWHWHKEFEFAIAVPGDSVFIVENHRVSLRPGDGIFINSQVLHAVERAAQAGTGLCSGVFHPRLVGGSPDSIFWEELVQPLLDQPALRYVVLKPEVFWQTSVLVHFQLAWDAMDREPEDYENLVRYHLSAALRLLVQNCLTAQASFSRQQQIDGARVRRMLEYIHEHYAGDITMEEIAGSINASKSVCLRCFRQMLGTTPIQYLKHYRLEQAARMLKTTAKTATEVAIDCGFNDVSYFTRSFR